MKGVILSVLVLILNSCIHLNPRIKVDHHFDGLNQQEFVTNQSRNELPPSKYIFIIHGIGSQDTNYSYEFMHSVAKYSEINANIKRTAMETYNQKTFLEKTEYVNDEGNRRLVFYTITWSDLTDSAKAQLEYYENSLSSNFHGISKPIKKMLMYQRVSDAFLAQEESRLIAISQAINEAVCDLAKETNDCKSLKNLNLVSGSFGSQVFIKYFHEASKRENKRKEGDVYGTIEKGPPLLDFSIDSLLFRDTLMNDTLDLKDWISRLKTAGDTIFKATSELVDMKADDTVQEISFPMPTCPSISNISDLTLNFYMLTNQVNLMDGNIQNWGGVKPGENIPDLPITEVNVVAFRNSNDLLCYYVPEEKIEQYFSDSVDIQVTNSYYWNFLVRNNAVQAHTAVFKLNKLAKSIVRGSNANWWVKEVNTRRR